MKSRSVRVWAIQVRNGVGKRRSYVVRWTVASREKSKAFATRALADKFRSDLHQAMGRGELFGVDSGLPESMEPVVPSQSWLTFAQSYVEMKWPGMAANSRDSINESLAAASAVFVADVVGRPDAPVLRKALRAMLRPYRLRDIELGASERAAWTWVTRSSIPLTEVLQPTVIRAGLEALALTLDGQAAAATTIRRKRAVLYNALEYAVELEYLPFNPIDKVRVVTNRKKVVGSVDRRVVVNPRQARELLTMLSYVGEQTKSGSRGERLVAFFACLYFAALRPSEALGLRMQDCHLPAEGWGTLTLAKSLPEAGKQWTDSGRVHDERGLKHRGEDEPRMVPIPPSLVAVLLEHIRRFGVGPDGHLFRSTKGNPVSASAYARIWELARQLAFDPQQAASPLAGRPYDLRHAAVSLWLNAGVAATEVAERAGHSVEVLLRVYAKCIDGQAASINARIERAVTDESSD